MNIVKRIIKHWKWGGLVNTFAILIFFGSFIAGVCIPPATLLASLLAKLTIGKVIIPWAVFLTQTLSLWVICFLLMNIAMLIDSYYCEKIGVKVE